MDWADAGVRGIGTAEWIMDERCIGKPVATKSEHGWCSGICDEAEADCSFSRNTLCLVTGRGKELKPKKRGRHFGIVMPLAFDCLRSQALRHMLH